MLAGGQQQWVTVPLEDWGQLRVLKAPQQGFVGCALKPHGSMVIDLPTAGGQEVEPGNSLKMDDQAAAYERSAKDDEWLHPPWIRPDLHLCEYVKEMIAEWGCLILQHSNASCDWGRLASNGKSFYLKQFEHCCRAGYRLQHWMEPNLPLWKRLSTKQLTLLFWHEWLKQALPVSYWGELGL